MNVRSLPPQEEVYERTPSMRTKRAAVFAIFCCSLLLSSNSHAQGQKRWTFEDRPYYPPLIAGVREPQVSALALAWADRMAFMVSDQSPRRVWDIDLGAELPLAGWESRGR